MHGLWLVHVGAFAEAPGITKTCPLPKTEYRSDNMELTSLPAVSIHGWTDDMVSSKH